MNIAARIESRLKILHKSERQACLEAGLSDSFIRNIRVGKSVSPRIDTLDKLAVVLQTSTAWLCAGQDAVVENGNAIIQQGVDFLEQHSLLQVYGQAVGGSEGEFILNGSPLYDVLCPPSLSNTVGAYAVEIVGDSMSPRYEEGEIAYIDPLHPIRRGDYVVVQLKDNGSDAPHAFIKRYLFKTEYELVLEQFNPPKRIKFPLGQVISMHYVAMAGARGSV
ncbi:XRE family transcriptional regulator [Bartonella sp. TP]|uniref:XRE family transcriptional regulator n=1 Tax=Bartonella sp. TP TaxID=3057550 RepID=UPI0025B11351|nr:XRE family transcriptional regulator [Bartonella sp. TP]WJW80518.1 S24 family peptidase [Bartonella sp. TP]